jgi:hypothetical protein
MVRPSRIEPQVAQRASAAAVSAVLHLAAAVAFLVPGDRHHGAYSGDTPITQLLLVEAPNADAREGIELVPLEPTWPAPEVQQPLARIEPPTAPIVDSQTIESVTASLLTPLEEVSPEATLVPPVDTPVTYEMSEAEKAALSERLAKLAERLSEASGSHVEWNDNGTLYSARLTLQRANEGTALDRVLAEVSASHRGKAVTTHVALKRLPFSQFTHMVDRWDPMVQFHDDEIVGRVHSNSPFNLAYDAWTAPRFLGKVTTAARTFYTDSIGRRRDSDIFRGGIQTRAGRIDLPEILQPFEWAPREPNARIHELADDTRIVFARDGRYVLETRGTSNVEPLTAYTDTDPVYFIARPGVTLYVQGVVAGKVLVYSPQRIVIERSLVYARDPRENPASEDFLGLVCDKYIEIAPHNVTGPGDLAIEAAIFAGRRFVVTNINHRRTGTLRVYGSLSAGSMSASEPRYATRLEYDRRFDERRPPGFPSTNRYEVANWDGQWTEIPERVAVDAY